jgi:soluble lytic murein transglycosylase
MYTPIIFKPIMYIRFILSITLAVIIAFTPASYADHVDHALRYADQKQWDKAIQETKHYSDPILRKIVFARQFLDTSYKHNDFGEVISFIENNPAWPNIDKLKEAAEHYITFSTNKNSIISWFSKHSAKTPNGHKFYAIAARGLITDESKLQHIIKSGWIYGNFSPDEEKNFLAKNKNIITAADHVKKIDYLLSTDQRGPARNLLSSRYGTGAKEKAVFDAYVAFLDNKSNKNTLYSKLPEAYKYNSGLLYKYLEQYKKDDIIPISAAKVMVQAPYDPMYHKDWWKLKNIFAKNMLQQKQYGLAYKIANNHEHNYYCNMDRSESQWLAGWIALRFLHNPKLAYEHFTKLHKIVAKPMSVARAAYWLGITSEAMKNRELSHKWFREATAFNFTFYGQLAMIEMKKTDLALPPMPKITPNDKAYYAKNELARATNIFIKHNRLESALLYAKAAIATAKNSGEAALIVSSIRNTSNRLYTVEIAKAAAQKGFFMGKDNYPTPYKVPHSKIEKPLTYSIILKESMFSPSAISYANAHGLMQLIPVTGCQMAKKLKHKCNVKRLTSDPVYNITLGNKYLEELLQQFNGSYILAAAAYNAGPEPVQRWIARNGDPRKMKNISQVVHWIESIPYYDTRDYVQRILESVQIYREIFNPTANIQIKKDLLRGSGKG